MVLVAAMLVGLLAGLGRPTSGTGGSLAEALLATDGHVETLTDNQGGTLTGEWARGAFKMIFAGPDPLTLWVNHVSFSPPEQLYARWSTVSTAGPQHRDTFFTVVDGEVRLQAQRADMVGDIYDDRRVELPATVTAGARWTSTGTVIPWRDGVLGDRVAYEATSSATEVANDSRRCLKVTTVETRAGEAPVETARTWCPSRGIVAESITAAGVTTAWSPLTEPPQPRTVSIVSQEFDWSRAADLSWTTEPETPPKANLFNAEPIAPLGQLPNGTLVIASRDDDVIGRNAQSSFTDKTVWRAHPGGVLLYSTTLGELTVVTNSLREAVGYGPNGERLWATLLPETSQVPAVAVGGLVVIVTIDGTVSALDPATGVVRWSAESDGEVAIAPLVISDGLIVIDLSGYATRYDESGEVVWKQYFGEADEIAISGDTVLTVLGTQLFAYELGTGYLRWQNWLSLNPSAAYGGDSTFVVVDSLGVHGLNPNSGDIEWTVATKSAGSTAGPDRLIVANTTDVVLVSFAGVELARWPHHLNAVGTGGIEISPLNDGFVIESDSLIFRGTLR